MKTTVVEELIYGDIEYKPDGTLWWKKSGRGRKTNTPIGSVGPSGYRNCTLCQTQIKAHHIVWFIHKGYWPESLDHINKNKDDNRIENLREGKSVNNHNRYMPLGESGLEGVHRSNKTFAPWRSSIKVSGENIHLGYFQCKYEAHRAYKHEKEKVYV